MLRGNYNDGNTYKMSIPQYISMKISDEPLLFVGGAFSYDMGNIHEFYRPIHIPRKKIRMEPFSARGVLRLCFGEMAKKESIG